MVRIVASVTEQRTRFKHVRILLNKLLRLSLADIKHLIFELSDFVFENLICIFLSA
jgi:hypothetical protein